MKNSKLFSVQRVRFLERIKEHNLLGKFAIFFGITISTVVFCFASTTTWETIKNKEWTSGSVLSPEDFNTILDRVMYISDEVNYQNFLTMFEVIVDKVTELENFITTNIGTGSVLNSLFQSTDGNIGVDTQTPTEKLEVNGNVKISGDLILEGALEQKSSNDVVQNMVAFRKAASASDVDCTLGGLYPNEDQSFKFDLGHGVSKCLYLFYVGDVHSTREQHVYTCPSYGLADSGGVKVISAMKKDYATWSKMWQKLITSPQQYGTMVFYDNAGDWVDYSNYTGIDLIYHYAYPNSVLTQYGIHNYSGVWTIPGYFNGQRSDYDANGWVVCELAP